MMINGHNVMIKTSRQRKVSLVGTSCQNGHGKISGSELKSSEEIFPPPLSTVMLDTP